MSSTTSGPDRAQLRNGIPCRMSVWMHVKYNRFSRRCHRFVQLNGEVLSFHLKEKGEPEQMFDVVGSVIEFTPSNNQPYYNQLDYHNSSQQTLQPLQPPPSASPPHRKSYLNPSSKQIKIITSKTYYLYLNSVEEAQSWGNSLVFASKHRFEDYYVLGKSIAEGTVSRVHKCYAIDHEQLALNSINSQSNLHSAPSHHFIEDDDDDDDDDINMNSNQQVFAVKIVKKRHHDSEALTWLQRERHINSLLNSETIVQMYDMFSTVDKDYLVFEYMKGGTLRDLLRKRGKLKPLPESYARVITRHLFTSLNYIHSKNIVHRDVDPENIFLSAKKFPMTIALGDFSLSNFVDDRKINSNILTSYVGISPYTSADVARRIPYGPSSDMWSAGVILYELLSGDLPFMGRNDRETMDQIKKGQFTFQNPKWESVTIEAKLLIKQLLQQDPLKRINALASLQHVWIMGNTNMYLSRPLSSMYIQSATSATSASISASAPQSRESDNNDMIDMAQQQQNQETPVRNKSMNTNLNMSMSSDQQRHPSSLGMGMGMAMTPSYKQLHAVPSVSSLSNAGSQQQPKLKMTPSVRLIQSEGLQKVTSENPARMKKLLSSKVVQQQLSMTLPYRRKLVIVSKAFVAVFRLRALSTGQHTSRQMSKLGVNSKVVGEEEDVDADEILKKRLEAVNSAIARTSKNFA